MKPHASLGLVILLAAGLARTSTAGDAPTNLPETPLCQALDIVRPGDRLRVRVSGIYVVGPELQVLYDPTTLTCPSDVQPSTWVEFEPHAATNGQLTAVLKKSGRAAVSFIGQLWGPASLHPDDLSLPSALSYVNRVSARYGHMNAFRTQLLVEEIRDVKPVADDVPWDWVASRPSSGRNLLVVHADLPSYPHALASGITGTVILTGTVRGGNVVNVAALSGDRILAVTAVTDVKAWKFDPHTDGTFTSEFVYQLERRAAGSDTAPRFEIHLPSMIRITGAADGW